MAKKRRELVNNLNLVPFIDLFSTLIIFLLATAVWQQLSSVPIQLGSTENKPIDMPSDTAETKRVNAELRAVINQNSLQLVYRNSRTRLRIEEARANDYEKVRDFVSSVRAANASQKEVVFEVSDKAQYEDLVKTMDQFLGEDFDELIVMGAR